jgi:hypothetical protein
MDFLAWLLLFAGLVGIAASAYIVARNRKERDSEWYCGLVGVAATSVATLIGTVQAINSAADAAKLQGELDAVKSKLVPRVKRLTASAMLEIEHALMSFPEKSIEVTILNPTPESSEFASKLIDVAAKRNRLAGATDAMGGSQGGEITLRYPRASAELAKALHEAMTKAALNDIEATEVMESLPNGASMEIVIAPKN